MLSTQVFTIIFCFSLQILVVTPSIHLEWSVFDNILGFSGCLLIDPLRFISYPL